MLLGRMGNAMGGRRSSMGGKSILVRIMFCLLVDSWSEESRFFVWVVGEEAKSRNVYNCCSVYLVSY